VAQFLTLALVVPALVTLGAPAALARRALPAGPRRPAGRLASAADPVNATALLLATVFAVYATPLLDVSLRNAYAHLFVNVAALAAGLLFFHAVLGGGHPAPAKAARDRLALLGVVVATLATFGAVLAARDTLLGGPWFPELAWPWADPGEDQRRAAVVVWAFAAAAGAASLAHHRFRGGDGQQRKG
jgi:putative copper resistance protein D